MVTIGMNYEVLEGKEEVFERAFTKVLETLTTTSGHVASHLYRDVHAERSYLIISNWSNREAFNAFIGSEQFARVTNWGQEQVLAGRPQHHVYQSADLASTD